MMHIQIKYDTGTYMSSYSLEESISKLINKHLPKTNNAKEYVRSMVLTKDNGRGNVFAMGVIKD